ncbi:hypothetical protein A2291_07395 [candidate division WOR-1 bacterium RIFOXYB2_FULL_42_35]|uniref:Thioester reductase (TE) domain-containing protein n=1 Tax=candidate division WOR-1 bacterium RIFOXYC2_FULL_41_25 TaxID=1802586 RepID=A0A1F4TK95_UNCSA|nr:MAG: hypothetical protein A2247_04255 [candidate division WOR-1 bacterium RIFOXYA2_FULL_41_14]OGC22730.1 MAG: hypothetical protein A2291_07395 [candidate division WOR-1 bacterium RIFOXYB2_FULL_42_35]OGC33151.1 MAG: hypothetical protein A2462_06290 [candidate division WOR-1 bacterium RIFOXYC2_FULL_41_25]OGC43553.1 MAG: hypothetical protein A2548_04035 [candidate division WOR-1 bacterium RIFOXYD2_FULL_41_8]
MRIVITGATGLLGRNLLFEIIKRNLSRLDDLEIIVLGRAKRNCLLRERFEDILIHDGLDYLGITLEGSLGLVEKIKEIIIPIPCDLASNKLGISPDDLMVLTRGKIDYFFHLAALSDFHTDKSSKRKLEITNILGTDRVIELIDLLDVNEIIYTGSAYSCGIVDGEVNSDFINLEEEFRNFYEESKLVAEFNFWKYAKKRGLKYRIFRPVGICGRLIEKQIGSICKYDLFYGWALFFLKAKLKAFKTLENIYEKPLEIPIRIACNLRSGLNIVPADYAAKMMYAVCTNDDTARSYHLSNEKEIPNEVYLPIILRKLNIIGCSFVDKEPVDKNELERLYYRTVGKIFTPYLAGKTCRFNEDNLKNIKEEINISCPVINKEKFELLIDFAMNNHFGLEPAYKKV